MSISVNGNAPQVTWQNVFDAINTESNVDKVSSDNKSVTFSMTVGESTSTVTVTIPSDLELPGEVNEAEIESLMRKLADPAFKLTDEQLLAFKDVVKSTYTTAATALGATQANTSSKAIFDLYQLMALLVDIAQQQRDAAREQRSAESQVIQNSIQAQADKQREAAIVGLVVGVVCGAVSALISVGTMIGQSVAYKGQVNAQQTSGTKAAQQNVSMTQKADTIQHAQAQYESVAHKVGGQTEARVSGEMMKSVEAQDAKLTNAMKAANSADGKLTRANGELSSLQKTQTTARAEATEARAAAGIEDEKPAMLAKSEYQLACQESNTPVDEAKIAKFDVAIAKENAAKQADAAVAQKEAEIAPLQEASTKAHAELETARGEYRAAVKTAADKYVDAYESAVARGASRSEIQAAKNDMKMARAWAGKELARDGVFSATDYRSDLMAAKEHSHMVTRELETDLKYRGSIHKMERLATVNSINQSLNGVLQSVAQSISGIIQADATAAGAQQQEAQEMLDQTKDLYEQAQGLVDAVVQLMQAVQSAETQSMRDAIMA